MAGAITITVEQAAKLMGVAPLRVRGLIRRQEVDFGVAYPSGVLNKWSRRDQHTTFVIFAPKFARFVGLTLDELRKEVQALNEGRV